ncbi:MAG: hypothetical protein FJW39_06240 [Acidobacteria bacterium]|nr:hypothetical protein [Acidobacteriota bacterium]
MRLFLPLLLTALPVLARLRAGAHAADITPQEWPVRLIGNFGLTLAQSAHDPLHVRAIVLEEGANRVAIAVIDSCLVKRDVMDEAKAIASKRTGIPTSHMLIAATHTHSAPPSDASKRDSLEGRYVQRIIDQTANAIATAHSRLEPARIGYAVRYVPEELFNRRWFMTDGSIPPNPFGETHDKARMNPPAGSRDLIHPAGPTDPGFSIVSIRNEAGKPLALLGNYSLHYVGGIPANQVSSDYFGEFAHQVSKALAQDNPSFVAILSNGTSGDVNNIDFVHPRPRAEPMQRIREVATRIAGHAVEASRTMEYTGTAELRSAERELELAYRKPTPAQLTFAQAALKEADESKLPRNAKAYAERALRLQEGPATALIKLQAMRIGGFAIAAIPFEVFTEIGLAIKERSAVKPVFTIELANGHWGYLPTPRHHELGGYETWLGTNNVEKGASVKITDVILELLERVK